MNTKTKRIIGWMMAGILSLLFLGSGGAKLFAQDPEMVEALGGSTNMIVLGLIEVVMVVLFLVPRTGVIGTLLMVAYMGGAMAVHLTTGQSMIVPTAIQMVIWITAAIRFPELFGRVINAETFKA